MSLHSSFLSNLYQLTSPPPGDAELLRRWVTQRDEDAFTVLVSRHGRMVLGVCCRVLGNNHDAEDAFQAVFLTLARKAATLRHPEALPGWLHGVAMRLAHQARIYAVRRRRGDPRFSADESADPYPDPLETLSARELLGLIDQEIARLPEKYRLPLVLCDLEARTQPEAARLLGWTAGSFRGRLLRGRERLRARLRQRGIAPAVLVAVCLQGTADATGLTARVSRLAVRFVACPSSATLSPSVAALVGEGMPRLIGTKLKLASVALLAASTLIAGAGLLAWSPPTSPPAQVHAEDKSSSAQANTNPQGRHDQAGDPLPAEAISRLGTIRFRQGARIQSLVFTPDGKTLVSEGEDGIRIWEAATGKQIRRVGNGWAGGNAIALSPDGTLVAFMLPNQEGYVGLMEVATGRIVRRFSKRQVHAPYFSPDGKRLATVGYHAEIDLWDPATGESLGTLKGHQDAIYAVTFSADGKTLVSGSDDRTIRFWDVSAGKELRQIKTENGVAEIAPSPDGSLLASLGHVKQEDRQMRSYWHDTTAVIQLWDARTGKELRRLTTHPKKGSPNGFSHLAFTPDGKTLVTSGPDGVIRIWDAATGKEMRSFSGRGGWPFGFALHPDGQSLAVASGGSTIHLIRLDTGADVLALQGHRAYIGSLLVRPGGRVAVTAAGDGFLRFWDAQTGKMQREKATGHAAIWMRADGTTYLEGGEDKKLRIRDLDSGKEIRVFQGWNGNRDLSYGFSLSPDGNTLAQFDASNNKVHLIDSATGKMLHVLTEFNQPFMGLTFSPDGRSLFLWSADKTVTIWDTATGAKRRQLPGPTTKEKEGRKPPGLSSYSVFRATLSPDGKLLAFGLQSTGHDPGILPIVDTTSGKEVRCFTTAKDGVSQLEFSPDGNSLAWGGWRDGTIYLGEIATGRIRSRFMGHQGRIFSLAFAADGQTLLSGSQDTTALVWDLTGRLTMKNVGKALTAEELATQWQTLADDDATAAYRAIQVLAADPNRSIAYLRKRLHPVAPVDEKQLQQWIMDLDSDQFAVRDKATRALRKAGTVALPAMRKALEDKTTLETRRRLEQLIDQEEREMWSPSADALRTRRALEVLERAGTPEARDVLRTLANGAPGAWQTIESTSALERLTQRPTGKH